MSYRDPFLAICLGLSFLGIWITGVYSHWVALGWPIALSGVVLVILGVLALREPAHQGSGWGLLVLIFIMLLVAPGPLMPSAPAEAPHMHARLSFPPIDPDQEMTVEEFRNRFYFGDREELAGAEVTMIGVASEGYLHRLKIVCCAADAVTYSIRVNTELPDGWVKVTGILGEETDPPTLNIHSYQQIPEPARPYL